MRFINEIWVLVHINCININSFMTESLSYSNQFIELLRKSMDWFLYDRGLHHERVNLILYVFRLNALDFYRKVQTVK